MSDAIFDFLFNSFTGYFAETLFLAGLFLFPVGVIVAGDWIAWLMRGTKVEGHIAAVKSSGMRRSDEEWAKEYGADNPSLANLKKQHYSGQTYTPIYEYTGPDGKPVRSESRSSDSWLASKVPGRSVTLLVKPGKPDEAQPQGLFQLIFGLVLLAPGAAMILGALAMAGLNVFLGPIVLGGIISGFWKLIEIWKTRPQWAEKKARFEQKRKEKKEKKQSQGYIMTPAEIDERIALIDEGYLLGLPLFAMFGVVIIGIGVSIAMDEYNYYSRIDISTRGEVTAVSRDSHMYETTIVFKTAEGESVEFTDERGGFTQPYRTGQKVPVVYKPKHPDRAAVGHSRAVWFIPAAMVLAGGFAAWWPLKNWFGVVSRVRKRRQK